MVPSGSERPRQTQALRPRFARPRSRRQAGEGGVIRRGESIEVGDLHGRSSTSARSRPSFPEFGRIGLVDLPIEEIVIAGPRVDQPAAHFASEAAGPPGWLLFLGRAVGQRATGTAVVFDGEKTACHAAMMLSTAALSSWTGCNSQRPATPTVEAGGVRDRDFLTRRIRVLAVAVRFAALKPRRTCFALKVLASCRSPKGGTWGAYGIARTPMVFLVRPRNASRR